MSLNDWIQHSNVDKKLSLSAIMKGRLNSLVLQHNSDFKKKKMVKRITSIIIFREIRSNSNFPKKNIENYIEIKWGFMNTNISFTSRVTNTFY